MLIRQVVGEEFQREREALRGRRQTAERGVRPAPARPTKK
jgi:hypothetical protein